MRRATTLVEIVIYSALLLLVLAAVAALLMASRRTFEQTTSAFLINAEFDQAIRQLRRDLRETMLGSLRVYPHVDGSGAVRREPPGLVMAMGRNPDGSVDLNSSGYPRWDAYVAYTVVPASEPGLGRLIRWETPRAGTSLATLLPSALPAQGHQRVVASGIVLPNTQIAEAGQSTGPQGGFDVRFVRRLGKQVTLSSWNPAQVTAGLASGLTTGGNTGLVELTLRDLIYSAATGRPSAVVVRLRVAPRY